MRSERIADNWRGALPVCALVFPGSPHRLPSSLLSSLSLKTVRNCVSNCQGVFGTLVPDLASDSIGSGAPFFSLDSGFFSHPTTPHGKSFYLIHVFFVFRIFTKRKTILCKGPALTTIFIQWSNSSHSGCIKKYICFLSYSYGREVHIADCIL